MAAFVAIEMRSDHPMLDLSLFRKPAFNGVSAVAFGLSAGMFAMFLYLTIYMQGVLGFSPLEAGLRFLPLTVLSFIASPIAGTLSDRIPIRVLLGVGLTMVGVGLLLMHGVSADSSVDDAARRASSSPASASGSPTRASARRRSPSSRSRKPGWARGSTPPSARSGSRPGSPRSAPIFQSQVDSKLSDAAASRPARARRTRLLGRLPRRRRGCAARAPRRSRPRLEGRLRQRLQRDPPDRRRSSPSSAPPWASPWSARATSCDSRKRDPARRARSGIGRRRAGATQSRCCVSCGSRTCC